MPAALFSCIQSTRVRIEFDAGKNARNIASRGLSFELVAEIDRDSALAVGDRRRDRRMGSETKSFSFEASAMTTSHSASDFVSDPILARA